MKKGKTDKNGVNDWRKNKSKNSDRRVHSFLKKENNG